MAEALPELEKAFCEFRNRVHRLVAFPVMGPDPRVYMASFLAEEEERKMFCFCLEAVSWPAGEQLEEVSSNKRPSALPDELDRRQCGFCGQSFQGISSLMAHLYEVAQEAKTVFDRVLHSRAKAFNSCPTCNIVFDTEGERMKHFAQESRENTFFRYICNRGQPSVNHYDQIQIVQSFVESAKRVLSRSCFLNNTDLAKLLKTPVPRLMLRIEKKKKSCPKRILGEPPACGKAKKTGRMLSNARALR